MDWGIYAGDTSKTIYVRLRDSTTGLAKTGLVFNSAGFSCYYTLPGAAAVQIALVTTTVAAAWTSGGFVLVHDTNAKGLYRLDLPNAAIASGAFVIISIEFDGVIEESMEIQLHTPVVALGDVAHGGTAAVLTLERMIVIATTADSHAVVLTGKGTGSGLACVAADTGSGLQATGGVTNGPGIQATARAGNKSGLRCAGNGAGAGLDAEGGATGRGGHFRGGITSGVGMQVLAQGGGSAGVALVGNAGGAGLDSRGGVTGKGAHLRGGATGGVGLHVIAQGGNSIGVQLIGAGSGKDISAAEIDLIDTNVDTLLDRVKSTLFTGITSLAEWLGLLAGKQAADATALTEIKASGAGSGTYSETTDSLEAGAEAVAAAQSDLDVITGAAGALLDTTATSPQLVDDVWDELLTGATHNINNSAGKRLRQVAGFVVTDGTAQAGTAGTITLAAGESATNEIFRGDRIIIVGGTGVGEHGIITAYNGSTKVATMAENWVITPDATSEYELAPATVDVETWQHNVVTGLGDLLQVEADTARLTAARAAVLTDWIDGGRLDLILDIIAVDTTTDIPALIATAQSDLDKLTGADGATLASAQGNYAPAIPSEVLTQVNAAIDTAISELGVAAPTATPTLRTGMMLMYMALRDKLIVQTSGTDAIEIHNDAGTKITSKLVTDDGSDYTEAKMS